MIDGVIGSGTVDIVFKIDWIEAQHMCVVYIGEAIILYICYKTVPL